MSDEIERIRRQATYAADGPPGALSAWAADCLILLAEVDRLRQVVDGVLAGECDCGGLNACARCTVEGEARINDG